MRRVSDRSLAKKLKTKEEAGKTCERAAAILNGMERLEGAVGRRRKAGGRCAPIRPFPARLAEDGKLAFGR
jgi:hypothetical protein